MLSLRVYYPSIAGGIYIFLPRAKEWKGMLFNTVHQNILAAIKLGNLAGNDCVSIWNLVITTDQIEKVYCNHVPCDTAPPDWEAPGETCERKNRVHDHHIHSYIWNPTIIEQLVCKREVSNPQETYAVASMFPEKLQPECFSCKNSNYLFD